MLRGWDGCGQGRMGALMEAEHPHTGPAPIPAQCCLSAHALRRRSRQAANPTHLTHSPGLRTFLEQGHCDRTRLLGSSCGPESSYPSLCVLKSTGLGTGRGRLAAQVNRKSRLVPRGARTLGALRRLHVHRQKGGASRPLPPPGVGCPTRRAGRNPARLPASPQPPAPPSSAAERHQDRGPAGRGPAGQET